MPWRNDAESRRLSSETYGDPEYKRNKAIVRRRSGGRCEWTEAGQRCYSRDRVQCDHIIPRSRHGSHAVSNLRDLCKPHHDKKTGREGAGGRHREPADPAPQARTSW